MNSTLRWIALAVAFVFGLFIWATSEKPKPPKESRPPMLYYEGANPLPFSSDAISRLKKAGYSNADILTAALALSRNAETHAYRRYNDNLPNNPDIIRIAQYASIVIGEGISPELIVATLRSEIIRGKFVGFCSIQDIKNGIEKERKLATSEKTLRAFRKKEEAFRKEEAAFKEIVRNINASRNPRYRMPNSYPRVSCSAKGGTGGDIGPFQIMPALYMIYEPEVREALGLKKFADPYYLLPSLFAATAILRDSAKYHRIAPRHVQASNETLIMKIAATYHAGPHNWKRHVGEDGYGARTLTNIKEMELK